MVALKEEKNGGGEIDLVRLFQILWKGKWIILVVALIFGIVAAIYAYTSKPVYEASIAVLPPSLSNVAGFNQGRRSRVFRHLKFRMSIPCSCAIFKLMRLGTASSRMSTCRR